jgi:hypothetical protein
MGRPKSFSREEVLEKAMPVFWKHGFSDTSLQDLERATGDPVGIDQPFLGIAADGPGISDPVALLDVGHIRTNRFDYSGAFDAGGERQRLRVQAGAVIDVDEVEARRFLA